MSEFKEQLALKAKNMENIIESFLPKEEGNAKLIYEAVNYSVKAGGKRLRPILMSECFKLLGGKKEDEELLLYPFISAIEMIHTYSLVHDDLPAMDNDMLRRGKPTTHAAYGEDIGILAGDALLNMAFEVTSSIANSCGITPEKALRAMKAMNVLATKAGALGMIGGQVLDIKGVDSFPDEAAFFEEMYTLKTGCLLEAAMMCGGILAGCTDEEAKKLEEAGYNLGLAFQIRDDILDEISTVEELGKPIHSDLDNNKKTYAAIVGFTKADAMALEYSEKALEIISNLGEDSSFLEELFLYLVSRRN